MKIGCIGQGFVGKNFTDDLENRGYSVVRYSLDDQHIVNKDQLKDCEMVFIAVPTPTTPEGFNFSAIEEVMDYIGEGQIAVIKSTVLPGTTKKIQERFSNKIVLCSPEFLSESTAAFESARPYVNVVGMAYDTPTHRKAAQKIIAVLPKTDHNFIVSAVAAELYKYAHNINGYMRIMLTNLLYDLGNEHDIDWADVKLMIESDIMMSPYYNKPVHKKGRGAGGNCFIKDLAAFRFAYEGLLPEDIEGINLLKALEAKNVQLLNATGKSQEIIKQVYG